MDRLLITGQHLSTLDDLLRRIQQQDLVLDTLPTPHALLAASLDQENNQGVVMTESGCVYLANLQQRQLTLLSGSIDSRFTYCNYSLDENRLFASVSSNNMVRVFAGPSGEMLT